MNGERLLERLEDRGWSQAELARRVGVSPQSIGKLARGESQGSKHLHRIAALLLTTPEYLLGETDEPGLEAVATVRHRERLSRAVETEQVVDVPMIDLAYGMGGTYLDDLNDDAEVVTEPFPLSFIRRYTRAKPDNLVFAEGMGDSMAPTITSNDLMLIDQSDNTLRIADQIWAFSFGGVGMIKRLRPRPDGSIAILSDNPNVPEDRAVDDELFLIGRVVAKVSKL
ncbi:S24 family peptidase [Citromicrobium bathyomarinum]|uniref:XRE family transcriptional regulator n=1 Tax=Citromicrobium bathyomarinum TaxID=72174 RepID=UPI00315B3A88